MELNEKLFSLTDIAMTVPIEVVHASVSKNNEWSIILYDVLTLRQPFELFCTQLLKSLSQSENWDSILNDLNDRYLIDIERYLNWYENKKSETKIFGYYNPYEVLFDICTMTKREILKYQ